jgi:hypothetical protein
MKQEELVKGLTYLGMAYGKEYSKLECEQHYDFLKEYSYETFVPAIKNIIKTSTFVPKISDLINACESAKSTTRFDVIEFMNKVGYFKHPKEYEKATLFMEKGIVPEWLQKDINKYYKQMVSNRLDHNEMLMIESK